MKHRNYIWLVASVQVLLGCHTIGAQQAQVSVAWKIAPACGANFAIGPLQQDLEDQLRAESIGVSRVSAAGLVADINCQSFGLRSVSVQQCFALSQAVPDASAANGLHLATTWRNCQSYVCSKQSCGESARAARRTLTSQVIAALRTAPGQTATAAKETRPAEQTPIPLIPAAIPASVLNPGAIFYILYILTCIAVLIRWQWCRHIAFAARHGAAATLHQ